MQSVTTRPRQRTLFDQTERPPFKLSDLPGPAFNIPFALVDALGWNAALFLSQLDHYTNSEACAGYVDAAGVKWIYNIYKGWADILRKSVNACRDSAQLLLDEKLIIREYIGREQIPIYRIDYDVYIPFLESIGLKPSDNAGRDHSGAAAPDHSGAGTQERLGTNRKHFFKHVFTKSKQQARRAVSAFSRKRSGETAPRLDETAQAPAARSARAQDRPSDHGDPAGKADLPPAAGAPLGQRFPLEQLDDAGQAKAAEVLEGLAAIEISRENGIDLIERFGLELVAQQLEWLPLRKPGRNAAGLLIKSLGGPNRPPYDPPAAVRKAQKQAEKQAAAADETSLIAAFLQKLEPFKTKLKRPTGEIYLFINQAGSSLWVRDAQNPQDSGIPVSPKTAMKWELAPI